MKIPRNYKEALVDYYASEFNRGTQYIVDQASSLVFTDSVIFYGVHSLTNLSGVLSTSGGRIVSCSTQFNVPAPGSDDFIENVTMWDMDYHCFTMFCVAYQSSSYFTSEPGIGYAQDIYSVAVTRIWGEDDRVQITAVRRYMRKVFKHTFEDEIFDMILVHLRALMYQDNVHAYAFRTNPDTSLRLNVAPVLIDPYSDLPILVDVILGVPEP